MLSSQTFSGQKLRQRRKAQRVSRDALAFYIGRTTGTVGNYEREFTQPPADVLADIARYLDCEIQDLYEDVDA